MLLQRKIAQVVQYRLRTPSSITTKQRSTAYLGVLLAFSLSCSDSCGDDVHSSPIVQKLNKDSALILGPNAESRIGDYILDNGLVRFAFQRPSSATGWGVYGGSLVDIDSYSSSAGGAKNSDHFQELFPHCNLRGFKAKSARIVAAGSDTEPGILRIVGTDGGFPLFDALLPSAPLEVEFTLEIRLAPNSQTLEFSHQVKDLSKTEPRDLYCGLIVIPGDTYTPFIANYGREITGVSTEVPHLLVASSGASSLALARKQGGFDLLAPRAEVIILNTENRSLLANDVRIEDYTLSVGSNGDVESAFSAMRAYKEDAESRQSVELSLSTKLPTETFRDRLVIRTAAVFGDSQKSPRTEAFIDEDGTANLSLVDGTYELGIYLDDARVSEVTIDVSGPLSQKIELLGFGLVRSTALAKYKKWGELASPVRLNFLAGHDASLSSGIVSRRYVQAEDSFVMPAGDYTVVAAKGPEFEFDVQNITVSDGEETALKLVVEQVVDSSGWASGDYHVHGARSMDSTANREIRVIAAVAEGLDILVSTDHDVITDYGPYAKSLGLEDRLYTVPGLEISPLYGHMNAYPMPVAEKEPYWSLRWWEYDLNEKFSGVLTPADLASEAKSQGAQIVAVNHPRDNQAVFDYLRLDDKGAITGEWPDFDAFELMNDTSASDIPQLLQDWMALFSVNRRLTAMGVSDSHGEFGLGYSRTYIKVPNDDPAQIDETKLWANLKAGHAVATTGPFVLMSVTQQGETSHIGDTVVSSTPLRFDIEVQAPSWMKVEKARLMENGVELARASIPGAQSEGVQLRHTFTATPTKDSIYFLIVDGVPGERHSLVIDGEARAITNPIFVDVDSDGFRYRP